MPTIDLTDELLAAVIAALKEKLDRDPYPRVPRLEPFREALAKLDPSWVPKLPRTLPASVVAEIPTRLHDAAEAFYFAGILSTAWFYGRGAAPNQHSSIERALDGILMGGNKRNQADAPSVVNLAFSIELYIKLLRFLADGQLMQGHNLHDLYLELETAAPDAGAAAIRWHRGARGCRDEFLEYLDDIKRIFEDWRYAYEKDFLVVDPDNVHALADAFRAAMNELHPDQQSTFQSIFDQ